MCQIKNSYPRKKVISLNCLKDITYIPIQYTIIYRGICILKIQLKSQVRAITYKFDKIRGLVPKSTIVIYFALYQSIFQYGLFVWGELGDSILNKLQINQNNIIRICLNESSFQGSTRQSYSNLSVLSIKFLYKKKLQLCSFLRISSKVKNEHFIMVKRKTVKENIQTTLHYITFQ